MPIVHDATPDDAESIGEAHAEAWRIGYDELFPVPCCYFPCPVGRRRGSRYVGRSRRCPALGGTLLAASPRVLGFIHFGPASGNDEIG